MSDDLLKRMDYRDAAYPDSEIGQEAAEAAARIRALEAQLTALSALETYPKTVFYRVSWAEEKKD